MDNEAASSSTHRRRPSRIATAAARRATRSTRRPAGNQTRSPSSNGALTDSPPASRTSFTSFSRRLSYWPEEWLLQATPVQLGFDAELTWYSYRNGCAKPSPALFKKALRMLTNRGIAPQRVAFIGNDMRNDIRPAQLAGFQTVLFAGDSRSLRLRADDPLCKDLKPDRMIIDLNQLIPDLR